MKIGIDISQVVYGTGVSVYTKNLVENLLKIDRKNQYLLFGSSLRRKKELHRYIAILLKRYPNVSAKIFPIPPTLLSLIWNKWHILPIENFIGNVDVFFSSDWTQPPVKQAKLITVVHDLVPWRYPKTLPKKIITTHHNRIKWVKKEVGVIIADSQSTQNDLIKIIKIPKRKIYVVYPGIDKKRFCPQNKEKINQIKRKYGLSNYILAVSTREPRKNFIRIIEAFKKLSAQGGPASGRKNRNFQLAIAGKYGWGEETKKLKNSKTPKLKTLGYVPDGDLAPLYSGARCFVYPSLYEGFGLPILEAMACGCPVVTSNISSMPEVASEAAILINPRKTTEITKAINKIINNEKMAEKLSKKGIEQAKKFSWEKCAKEVLGIMYRV